MSGGPPVIPREHLFKMSSSSLEALAREYQPGEFIGIRHSGKTKEEQREALIDLFAAKEPSPKAPKQWTQAAVEKLGGFALRVAAMAAGPAEYRRIQSSKKMAAGKKREALRGLLLRSATAKKQGDPSAQPAPHPLASYRRADEEGYDDAPDEEPEEQATARVVGGPAEPVKSKRPLAPDLMALQLLSFLPAAAGMEPYPMSQLRIPTRSPAYRVQAQLLAPLIRVIEDIALAPVFRFGELENALRFAATARRLADYAADHGLAVIDLGPVLQALRREAMDLLFAGKDDGDDATKFRRLLVYGLSTGEPPMEAMSFLIGYLSAQNLLPRWDGPAEAIEDLLKWAHCAWKVSSAEGQEIRRRCNAAWAVQDHTTRPWPQPTVAMARAVISVKPARTKVPKKNVGKTRVGILRFFQKCVQHLELGNEVDVPTSWFTEYKDPNDPTAFVGISSARYQGILSTLEHAGYLVLVRAGLGPQSRRYRLQLPITLPADNAVVPNAEQLLREKADDDVESRLLNITGAATTKPFTAVPEPKPEETPPKKTSHPDQRS